MNSEADYEKKKAFDIISQRIANSGVTFESEEDQHEEALDESPRNQ